MAKKQKFAADDAPIQAPEGITTIQMDPSNVGEVHDAVAEAVGEPKVSPIGQAKPRVYLEDEQGVQYQLTRFAMPKRAQKQPEGEFKVEVDGVVYPVWSTSSKGWAADDKSIDYLWIQLDENTAGYITLDYGVPAANYNDYIFKRGEGQANRKDPERKPKDAAKEENRKVQALATFNKNREAAEAAKASANGEQASGDTSAAS